MKGSTSQIHEKYWVHLIRNEPGVVELTQQEYENNRGIKQTGPGGQHDKDGAENMGAHPTEAFSVSLSGENTKEEIITELLRRGAGSISKLRQKTKKMLIEML